MEDTMIFYRDMTYCSFYRKCTAKCYRKLTPEIKKEAADFGLSPCIFMKKPDCFKPVQNSHGNIAKGGKR